MGVVKLNAKHSSLLRAHKEDTHLVSKVVQLEEGGASFNLRLHKCGWGHFNIAVLKVVVSEADQRGMRTREGWGPVRGGGLTLTHQSLLQTLTTCTQQSEHGRSLRAVSRGGKGWGEKKGRWKEGEESKR